jgi:magnesium transporter
MEAQNPVTAAAETQKSHDILEQNLEQVRALLARHRVVEFMVHSQESARQELVESLVHRENLAKLRNRLLRLHPADLAYILEALPPGERMVAWQQIRDDRGGEVLLEMSDAVRRQLIDVTDPEQLFSALQALDADDLSYIAEDLPEDILQRCLQSLSAEERTWVEAAIRYPENSVGVLMSNIMVTARETDTLAQVQEQLRGMDELPIHTDKLFVLDRRGLFKGVLSLQTMLLSRPDATVADVMATDVVRFRADDSAQDAAQAFERYDLVSAPVVNERGKLAGRLTVDVMMDYLRQRTSDELLKLAGLSREEDIFLTIWSSARNRWAWLSLNLLTAFVASHVIGLFEASIVQLVALAALMPIVASVGGNTGNQTTALVIRAITMGQLTASNAMQMIRKELGISVLNGVLFGIVVALFAILLYHNLALGLVIASAMLLNITLAAAVGLGVPLTLHRFGKDPALGSSVLLTAVTDSMGFFIFLGLATMFLL